MRCVCAGVIGGTSSCPVSKYAGGLYIWDKAGGTDKMAGRPQKSYDKSVFRSFAMVLQFGINMLVPICMMSALGIYLDRRFGTSYWMVILFFAGAIAGGQNVFRLARRVYAPSGKEEKKESRNGMQTKQDE